jgi:hypothetical protein
MASDDPQVTKKPEEPGKEDGSGWLMVGLGLVGALAAVWQIFGAKGGRKQQAAPAGETPDPESGSAKPVPAAPAGTPPAAGGGVVPQPAPGPGPSLGFDRIYRHTYEVRGQTQLKPVWGMGGGVDLKVSMPIQAHAAHVRLTADGRFACWEDRGPVSKEGAYALAGDAVTFSASDGTSVVGRLSADRMSLTIGNLVYGALTPEGEDVTGPRLKGTYHRTGILDERCNPIDNHITFTPDGRFEEKGFLYATLGGPPIGPYSRTQAGQGTYRITDTTLELTYTDGRRISMRYSSYGDNSLTLNTYTFGRRPGG